MDAIAKAVLVGMAVPGIACSAFIARKRSTSIGAGSRYQGGGSVRLGKPYQAVTSKAAVRFAIRGITSITFPYAGEPVSRLCLRPEAY
jgi:hypothetical protein